MNVEKNIAIGKILSAVRKQKNLHQIDLASYLGKPQSFISKIETGQHNLAVYELIDYANACNVDPVKLFALIEKNLKQ